jgi:hypothetical protein
MPYAFSLILWMAIAQTAGQPATQSAPTAALAAAPAAAPTAAPAAVVVQCPPGDAERALQDQLDEVRGRLDEALRDAAEAKEQLAKLKEEAGMPDHAVAALLVSENPELAPLRRVIRKVVAGAGMRRIRDVQADVYVSDDPHVTMAAVVLTTRNPREAPTWEPTEGLLRTPSYWQDPPVPVAVHSSPERIRPGETARIALVFDRLDVNLDESYATLALLRDGKWEMEIELEPSDFQVASATSGGAQ